MRLHSSHGRESVVDVMGLDGVELVLAWEEAFAISIPEEESVKMYSSRQAAAWIYSQVRSTLPEGTMAASQLEHSAS